MSAIDNRIINLSDLALVHNRRNAAFEARTVRIGPLLGARDLGCTYCVVPAGKRAAPFHSHRGQEEMFFIVCGRGLLRYGDEVRPLRTGDLVYCPTGGPETAHQIVNDSDEDLAYLCVSTITTVEIVEYPDVGRVGSYAGDFAADFLLVSEAGQALSYWGDED